MTIKTLIRTLSASAAVLIPALSASALDNRGIVSDTPQPGYFPLITPDGDLSSPTPIVTDRNDLPGISIAVNNLSIDFGKVCGSIPSISTISNPGDTALPHRMILAASVQSPLIKELFKTKKLNEADLKGKYEKYVMTTVQNPYPGVEEALVIAGSDRRGTIYGIYELSEQIGVSPWYDWADVPPARHESLYMAPGTYTAGEPAVKYRGIFLNDEGPCLMQWVKNLSLIPL
ncbi:MAG: glycosyl hydrolase 115 family protein [Muribaculaceae bacterium]|nr:glycosyl hydrolase 115 family protein [Muribaculaceae bacterium]